MNRAKKISAIEITLQERKGSLEGRDKKVPVRSNKNRKPSKNNRRLSDAESKRVMAKFEAQGERCDEIDNSIVEIERYCSGVTSETRHTKIHSKAKSASFTEAVTGHRNRRLTKKQFQRLMNRISNIEGNKEGIVAPIIDTGLCKKELTLKEQLELVLGSLSQYYPNALGQYLEIVKKKRFKIKDRLNIITWLIDKENAKKPLCLLKKNEKYTGVRKTKLKTKGDVKIHPVRILPDDEFDREISGKKRTKKDIFDKMHIDKKIEWARHVNSIVNIGEAPDLFSNRLLDKNDLMHLAMKFACKMVDIKPFKSVYANSYWIIYRANKYMNQTTMQEDELNKKKVDAILDSLESREKKKLPILSTDELGDKIKKYIKDSGLYSLYKEWYKIRYRNPKTQNTQIQPKLPKKSLSLRLAVAFMNDSYKKTKLPNATKSSKSSKLSKIEFSSRLAIAFMNEYTNKNGLQYNYPNDE